MAIKSVKGTEVEAIAVKSNVGRLDEFGREMPDSRPMAPPVGYKAQPSMMEMIRQEMAAQARLAGSEEPETFEEADDFEVGDDFEPESPYEEYFEPTSTEELQRAFLEAQAAVQPAPSQQQPEAAPAAQGAAVSPPQAGGDGAKPQGGATS